VEQAAAPARDPPATNGVTGLIERVTFCIEESGFCLLRVKAGDPRELVTVVGSPPSVSAGARFRPPCCLLGVLLRCWSFRYVRPEQEHPLAHH
jgi:hypothetical protein